MRQVILLGHFLCDRVQGEERFAAHPRHFPSQVPPGGDSSQSVKEEMALILKMKKNHSFPAAIR